MDIQNIQKVIDKALSEDQNQLKQFIRSRLQINDEATVGQVVTFISGFVTMIPHMLTSIINSPAGSSTGIESTLAISKLEDYLLDDNDVIAEQEYSGLLGLLDDAYYVVTFLQALRGSLSIDVSGNINLEDAQRILIALIGHDVARQTEVKLADLLRDLFTRVPKTKTQQPLKDIIESSSDTLSSVGSSFSSSINTSSDFDLWRSSTTESRTSYTPPPDPFIEDGRGYPGGAYDNPSSSYYTPDYNDDYYNFNQ